MSKLNIDQTESELLKKAISQWEKDCLVNEYTARSLRESFEVRGFDWMRLAKYSFWIALICSGIAICTLVVNVSVLQWLRTLYYTPDVVIGIAAGIAATVLFLYGRTREKRYPEKVFSNEAFIFTGILFTACCVGYLGKTFDKEYHHFSLLFLVSVFVYGLLAWRFQSRLIWLFALISLGSWVGTETGYQTQWSHYFLGMNYPLRFVAFGVVLITAVYTLKRQKWLQYFWDLTYVVGLLYLFLSLWLLSIFGNYGELDAWWNVKQISLYYWGIISVVLALGFMFYGLKRNDILAREFGITFLIISLYTKYFEYFWNESNAAVFFSILAGSFWLIGRKAEKIWNLNATTKKKATDDAADQPAKQ